MGTFKLWLESLEGKHFEDQQKILTSVYKRIKGELLAELESMTANLSEYPNGGSGVLSKIEGYLQKLESIPVKVREGDEISSIRDWLQQIEKNQFVGDKATVATLFQKLFGRNFKRLEKSGKEKMAPPPQPGNIMKDKKSTTPPMGGNMIPQSPMNTTGMGEMPNMSGMPMAGAPPMPNPLGI